MISGVFDGTLSSIIQRSSSTSNMDVRLEPFIFSDDEKYMLYGITSNWRL